MEIFDFYDVLNSGILKNKKSVLSIGVFDGLHNGHKEIIKKLNSEKARIEKAVSIIITFNINPKKNTIGNIDTLRLREEYLKEFNIDYLLIIDFSPEFSRITAGEFVSMLLTLTNIQAVVVGNDFKFGSIKEQAGANDLDCFFLKNGKTVKVSVVGQILTEGGEKISSTLLRRLILKGKLNDYLMLSDKYYSLDLLGIKPIDKIDNGIVFNKKEFTQIIPPDGEWSCSLITNKIALDCNLVINKDYLILYNLNKFQNIEFDRLVFKGNTTK